MVQSCSILRRVQSDVCCVFYTCYIIYFFCLGGGGGDILEFKSGKGKLKGRWPVCPWLTERKWGVNSSELRRCEIANLVGWPQSWLPNNEPRTVFQSHVSFVWIIWCRKRKQCWGKCRLQLYVQTFGGRHNGRFWCPSLHTLLKRNKSISLRGGQTLKWQAVTYVDYITHIKMSASGRFTLQQNCSRLLSLNGNTSVCYHDCN